jgi:hypothetical protein
VGIWFDTVGPIDVEGPIRSVDSGIQLHSEGDVSVRAPVRCRAFNAGAEGRFENTATIRCGTFNRQGEIDVTALEDVRISGPLIAGYGGVSISSAGQTLVEKPIKSYHFFEFSVFEPGSIRLMGDQGVMVHHRLFGFGAPVTIDGGAGSVFVKASIPNRGQGVTIAADGDVTVDATISGREAFPLESVSAPVVIESRQGNVRLEGSVDVRGRLDHRVEVEGTRSRSTSSASMPPRAMPTTSGASRATPPGPVI